MSSAFRVEITSSLECLIRQILLVVARGPHGSIFSLSTPLIMLDFPLLVSPKWQNAHYQRKQYKLLYVFVLWSREILLNYPNLKHIHLLWFLPIYFWFNLNAYTNIVLVQQIAHSLGWPELRALFDFSAFLITCCPVSHRVSVYLNAHSSLNVFFPLFFSHPELLG